MGDLVPDSFSSVHKRVLTSNIKLFNYGRPHHCARLYLHSHLQDQSHFCVSAV